MNHKNYYKSISILSILIMTMLLATSSVAIAQNEEADLEQLLGSQQQQAEITVGIPGGPGFVSTSGYAFYPRSGSGEVEYLQGFVWNPLPTTDQYFMAPVNLPNGATITKVVIYYYDNSIDDLIVYLQRIPLVSGIETMATVVSSEYSGYGWAQTEVINNPEIDLQNYAYYLVVYLKGGNDWTLSLSGVRVDYGYPSYLPLINK